MLKSFVLAATLFLAACTTVPSAPVPENANDFRLGYSKQGLANAVRLHSINPQETPICSGTVIQEGFVLTAKHCTDIASLVAQDSYGNDHEIVKITHRADGADISLLIVPTIKCPCATLAPTPIEDLEEVMTVGFPYDVAATVSFGVFQTRVVLTEGSASEDTGNFLYCLVNVDPGNSGGGVYVLRNGIAYIVGVVSMAPPSGNTALAVEFAGSSL